MQPEPNHLPQNILTPTNVPETSNSSQYGFSPSPLLPEDLYGHLDDERSVSGDSNTSSDVSETRSTTNDLSRLKLEDSSSRRPKPSYHRISEYENALSPTPTKKRNEGPAFVVTSSKKGGRLDGLPLDKFPNGKHIFTTISYYVTYSNTKQRF